VLLVDLPFSAGWIEEILHQLRDVVYPILNNMGFQPSNVVKDFSTIHSMLKIDEHSMRILKPMAQW
jgi:hypothetical protein